MRRGKSRTAPTAEEIEAGDRRHAAREAAVRRACEVMGWDYRTAPAYAGIRQVALGNAVAVSVEKLHAMLDRIAPPESAP